MVLKICCTLESLEELYSVSEFQLETFCFTVTGYNGTKECMKITSGDSNMQWCLWVTWQLRSELLAVHLYMPLHLTIVPDFLQCLWVPINSREGEGGQMYTFAGIHFEELALVLLIRSTENSALHEKHLENFPKSILAWLSTKFHLKNSVKNDYLTKCHESPFKVTVIF